MTGWPNSPLTAEQAREAARGLTFEDVWAAMMETWQKIDEASAETDAQIAKNSAETDAQIAKNSAETDARIAKILAETDAQIAKNSAETDAKIAKMTAEIEKTLKELSANIGGVSNTLGKLTEEMVAARVLELFQDLGYKVATASRNKKFYKGSKSLAEADIFLENGDAVAVVEVKTSLEVYDVNRHKERISCIRDHMDERGDTRKIIGAVAGGVVPDDVREYAQQSGFYVLVQTGETIGLAEAPPGFKVKQW